MLKKFPFDPLVRNNSFAIIFEMLGVPLFYLLVQFERIRRYPSETLLAYCYYLPVKSSTSNLAEDRDSSSPVLGFTVTVSDPLTGYQWLRLFEEMDFLIPKANTLFR